MSFKIVVTDYEFPDLSVETAIASAAGLTLTPCQCRTEDEVVAAARDADAIINQYAPITARVIETLEKCRIISRYGIGLNTIDVPAASRKGIRIGNVPDGSLEEVSDHTLAMIYSLVRGLHRFNADMKRRRWSYDAAKPLYRLRGRTIGLLSFGLIPQTLARKLAGAGVTIIAHDPFANRGRAEELGVELVDFESLFARSDIVSVHVPLTESTRHIVGARALALLKPGAYLVNTARGPVIDEAALIAALESGRLAGAGLDVFEIEPLAEDSPLLGFDNVVLSPHAAWYSEDSETEIRSKTTRNVVDVLEGRDPTYFANKAALTESAA